jgi:hypothetical protein
MRPVLDGELADQDASGGWLDPEPAVRRLVLALAAANHRPWTDLVIGDHPHFGGDREDAVRRRELGRRRLAPGASPALA